MADGKIQTPFSEITSPGGLKCQEFGGRRGFEERQAAKPLSNRERKPTQNLKKRRTPFTVNSAMLKMLPAPWRNNFTRPLNATGHATTERLQFYLTVERVVSYCPFGLFKEPVITRGRIIGNDRIVQPFQRLNTCRIVPSAISEILLIDPITSKLCITTTIDANHPKWAL